MILLLISIFTAQAEEKNIIYSERTEIDFEAIDIDGELVKPQGALLIERGSVRFSPLIELRLDFDEEMNRSVNSIK
jgi:hypothetical protein